MSRTALPNEQVLRALAAIVTRIADGVQVEREWIIEQLDASGAIGESAAHGPYLTVSEAYTRMRIGRSKFYDLLHRRLLKTATVGARRMVPMSEIDRYMASLIGAGDQ